MSPSFKKCLVVGTGPAGLLAADLLASRGIATTVFERRSSAGWKILVAGSSRLNVSHEGEDLSSFYTKRSAEMALCLAKFGRDQWLTYLQGLGEETFLGTSRRYFIQSAKATNLLKSWMHRLQEKKVEFFFQEELETFTRAGSGIEVNFRSGRKETTDCLILALGGISWEERPSEWNRIFEHHGIGFTPFAPSNAGYELEAPPGFLEEHQGKPIKGLTLTTALGNKTGECMITRYGLEGTPIYSVGCAGIAHLDLKPDLAVDRLAQRIKEKQAKLSPGAELLMEALAPPEAFADPKSLARVMKNLPIHLLRPRPLTESISSRGGVVWDELKETLELKKMPGVYCVGEMVDWDAPTGGLLLQGCVSMAATAAEAVAQKLGV